MLRSLGHQVRLHRSNSWLRPFSTTSVLAKYPGASPFVDNVIYVDKDYIVINKPLPKVSQGERSKSLTTTAIQDLTDHFKTELSACNSMYATESGVWVFAKSRSVVRVIQTQLSDHSADCIYTAVVCSNQHHLERRSARRAGERPRGNIGNYIHYYPPSNRPQLRITDTNNHSYFTETLGVKPYKTQPVVTGWELISCSPVLPLCLLQLNSYTREARQLALHTEFSLQAPILGHLYPRSAYAWVRDALDLDANHSFLHSLYLGFTRILDDGSTIRFGIMAPLPDYIVKLCNHVQIPIPENFIKGGIYVNNEYVEGGVVEGLEGSWHRRYEKGS